MFIASAQTAAKVMTRYFPPTAGTGYTILQAESACQRIADLENELNRVRGRKVLADLELLKLAQELVDGSKQLDGILALTLLEVAQRIIDVTKQA